MKIISKTKTYTTQKKTSVSLMIAGIFTLCVAFLWGIGLFLQQRFSESQAQQASSAPSPFRSIAKDIAMVFDRAEEEQVNLKEDTTSVVVVFDPDEPTASLETTEYAIRPKNPDVNDDPRVKRLIKKYENGDPNDSQSNEELIEAER